MDTAEIYAVVLGSIFVVLIGWHLAAELSVSRHRLISAIRRRMMYTNLVKRQHGTNDFTAATALQLLVMMGLNIVACVVRLQPSGSSTRLAHVAMLNAIPLYLGGRTSFLVELFLGLPLPWYNMMHGWIGRILLTQALIHAFLEMNKKTSSPGLKENLVSGRKEIHTRTNIHSSYLRAQSLFSPPRYSISDAYTTKHS